MHRMIYLYFSVTTSEIVLGCFNKLLALWKSFSLLSSTLYNPLTSDDNMFKGTLPCTSVVTSKPHLRQFFYFFII